MLTVKCFFRVNTRLEYSRLPKQQDIISRRIGKLNEIAKEDWKRQMENEEQEENEEKQVCCTFMGITLRNSCSIILH